MSNPEREADADVNELSVLKSGVGGLTLLMLGGATRSARSSSFQTGGSMLAIKF